MADESQSRRVHYRVWIAASGDRRPQDCREVPVDAVAVGPAEPGTMSAAEAAKYVGAYNQASRSRRTPTWAVAIPINRNNPFIASHFVDKNAFPREVLAEAIVRFIEEDLNRR